MYKVWNIYKTILFIPKQSDLFQENRELFLCLFRTWCHNPVAAVALCLLTQNYFLVCKLLQTLYPFSILYNYISLTVVA